MAQLGWIVWNPNPDAFVLPFVEHPIRWYGVFFVLGLLLTYGVVRWMLARVIGEQRGAVTQRESADLVQSMVDQLCFFSVLGVLIGARLGYALFYDWEHMSSHPLDILKVWQGGLASHGGIVGLLAAVWFCAQRFRREVPSLTFLPVIDMVAVAAMLTFSLIRVGNFFNQEILGSPSELPWAVLFLNPADGSLIVPRHPVQLYESFFYLGLFFFLFWVWERTRQWPGMTFGIACVVAFAGRFFWEYFKVSQGGLVETAYISMGQLLSLPFVALGLFFIWRAKPVRA